MRMWMFKVQRIIGAIVVTGLFAGCGAASWQYVGKKKKAKPPQTIANPPAPTPTPTPTAVPTVAPVPQFTVTATPNPAPAGTPITFTGECGKDSKTNWNMGNGETREGKQFTYTYGREGTYTVTATCTDGANPPKTATITVVITPPKTGGGPGGGQNQNPGQNKRPGKAGTPYYYPLSSGGNGGGSCLDEPLDLEGEPASE